MSLLTLSHTDRWKGDNEMLYAIKCLTVVSWIPLWSEVGSANHSATSTLIMKYKILPSGVSLMCRFILQSPHQLPHGRSNFFILIVKYNFKILLINTFLFLFLIAYLIHLVSIFVQFIYPVSHFLLHILSTNSCHLHASLLLTCLTWIRTDNILNYFSLKRGLDIS